MARKIAPTLIAMQHDWCIHDLPPDSMSWADCDSDVQDQARAELRALLAVVRAAAKAMRVLRDAGQWADWASDEDKALDRALARLERVSKPRSGGDG